MKKKYIVWFFLINWVITWLFFLTLPYYSKKIPNNYSKILFLSEEERKGFIVGESLYKFIKFADNVLPPSSKYQIAGLKEESIETRRVQYYLYPHLNSKNAPFILVFNLSDYSEGGYKLYRALDNEKYILVKK